MATESRTMVDLPRLTLQAAVMPKTLNDEMRTIDVVWTTGARVLRGYFQQYWEQLSLDPKSVRMKRLNNGAPLLNAHDDMDACCVIGVVQPGSASIDGKRGVATLRFAKAEDSPEADQIYRMVKDGIVQNISVGYQTYEMTKVSDGGADKIPIMEATDWEPYELSVVPMGADDGAGFRAASTERHPCVFINTRKQERQMADDTETGTDTGGTRGGSPAAAATQAALTTRIENAKALAAAREAAAEDARINEQTRQLAIRGIADEANLGGQWADDLVRANCTVEQARAEAFKVVIRKEPGIDPYVRITAGEDARDKFVRGGMAWLLERSGHTDTIVEAKKVRRLAHNFDGVSTDPGEFRGMRLPDLARYALELRGRAPKGLHGESLIRAALQSRAGDQGMNTTSDFSILLEAVVNKIFMGWYALAPVTWPLWAGRKSVQDFRTSTFYRPGTFGVLDTVGESGEVKHKNIPDGEKRTMSPATKGNIIGITRRSLANDDMGAFQNLASNLGLAAALTVESDAFALITPNSGLGINYDANPLFHTSRINIGPTGTMSPTTIDVARATMAKQKDPSANQFLALRPVVWLGPVELGGTIKQFNTSTTDPTDNKAQGVSNKVQALFRDMVDSPYLSAVSATRHYLLADPALYPVFAVGFIDGQEAPRIETEQSFGFDGVQMKVILDYGTAVLDFRGAITCAGT
ncbi:MAG: HK97 family phage prohead protease [Actinomycetota bacterium]